MVDFQKVNVSWKGHMFQRMKIRIIKLLLSDPANILRDLHSVQGNKITALTRTSYKTSSRLKALKLQVLNYYP